VTPSDFDAALAEIQPSLGGGGLGSLSSLHAPHGLLPTGERHERAVKAIQSLTASPQPGRIISILLVGQPGCGKTALACASADALGFPFARLVSATAEAAAGGGARLGCPLAALALSAFSDARRSPQSVVVLDDLERLIGFSAVGPVFSNSALQALLVLLRTPPAKDKTLVVFATCANEAAAVSLGLSAAFDATVRLDLLDGGEAAQALLSHGALQGGEAAAEAAAAALVGSSPVGVKQLLQLVELARLRGGGAGVGVDELLETARLMQWSVAE
jgi:vesicle-fusing ATPase